MAKQSFYAVKVGKTPGVYKTWDECKAQVEGFPNAAYKKFKSELEAQSFMNGDIQTDVESKDSVKKSKSVTNLHSIDLPDGPYAFVDGSFNPETGVYGYGGFVCVGDEKHPVQGSGNDPEMAAMRNVAGEISGSMAAVKLAESMNIENLTILYDYMGIEHWANGDWKTNKKGTQDYAEFMNPENRRTNVVFQKVDAHTGIDGNEMADVMAKYSVGIPLTKSQQELYDSLNARPSVVPNQTPVSDVVITIPTSQIKTYNNQKKMFFDEIGYAKKSQMYVTDKKIVDVPNTGLSQVYFNKGDTVSVYNPVDGKARYNLDIESVKDSVDKFKNDKACHYAKVVASGEAKHRIKSDGAASKREVPDFVSLGLATESDDYSL